MFTFAGGTGLWECGVAAGTSFKLGKKEGREDSQRWST